MPELSEYVRALVDIFNDQSSEINALWGLMSAIAIGLLGFVYKEAHLRGECSRAGCLEFRVRGVRGG